MNIKEKFISNINPFEWNKNPQRDFCFAIGDKK